MKKYYPNTDSSPHFPDIEEKVIKFWQDEKVFEESVDFRPSDKDGNNNEWIFYDGPPFANGLPHYGHLMTSCVKDIYARYQTQKGQKVERRFGWDCHGLPAEMGAEKELEVSGRAAIEKYGIEKFNDHCRTSVMKYTDVWKKDITRMGRWVDFENDYKTMDTSYMESVLWAFKQLYEKGLVYESYRVMPYSWAAETPLSNFETRMDDAYREVEDKAVTVAFTLKDKPKGAPDGCDSYKILAWTTTPWTLPSNLALAVDPDMVYICTIKDNECYILASSATPRYAKELGEEIEDLSAWDEGHIGHSSHPMKGKELLGLEYEPLFPYFKDQPNAFKILSADFIEEGSGTGVVHMAPGFGEDDQRICDENDIEIVCPVDESGRFTDAIFDISEPEHLALKGLNVIRELTKSENDVFEQKQIDKFGLANLRIVFWLKQTGKLIKEELYPHSYPHCWRTDEPLIYKAVPSWYVEVTKIRDRMVELNQNINWIPDHIKDGQFGKWLENARDWSISRNRFWGTPIPVWRSDNPDNDEIYVFGSIEELEEFFDTKVEDLHKPFIDTLTKPDPDNSDYTISRVSDVFDCWFESGSMPFAQVHYPFENKEWFETHFPADFIVEYVGQTRGWFYTLMVLGTALFDSHPFKNCICHGVLLAEDGKKLSKKLKNYPDPNEMFDVYGADAIRWRIMSEPIMYGGNLAISKDGTDIRDVVRLIIKPIWNAYHFFSLYANTDGIKAELETDSRNLMDRYILAKAKHAVYIVEKSLDEFDTLTSCRAVSDFFEVLNNWYIRRNRDRFWREATEHDNDKKAAYDTLYTVLTTMCRAAAPLLPLILEEIYIGLTANGVHKAENSVHMTDFPDMAHVADEAHLMRDMDKIRDICNVGLSIRNESNIRIRQPLSKITIYGEDLFDLVDFKDLVADELNIKEVEFSNDLEAVAEKKLQVNLPVVGKRLGAKMKDIVAATKQGDWELVDGDKVKVADELLEGDEFTLLLKSKAEAGGAQALSTNDALIVLDLEEESGVKLMIIRPHRKTQIVTVNHAEYVFLTNLKESNSFYDAFDSATGQDPEFDLAFYIKKHIVNGTFSGFCLG